MMLGHLLCGLVFAVLIGVSCMLLELTIWNVIAALIVSANVGLGASVTAHSP